MIDDVPLLKPFEKCPDCGHLGRQHFHDPRCAETSGCMASVDSAYTVTNKRQCGCRRRRTPLPKAVA